MDEKKVVEFNEEEKAEVFDDGVADSEVVVKKETLVSKAKRLVKDNKKKILGAGALLIAGAIGMALGSRSKDSYDEEDDIIDGEATICDSDGSEDETNE